MPRKSKPKPALGRTFLKEWRLYRKFTQERVAERLDIDRTLLSKIENARSPYSQGLLEALAEAYHCSVADLIMRNPLDKDAVWSITDNLRKASQPLREQAVRIIDALLKTGT